MAREELNSEELEGVSGGSYITTSMSISEIIATDRNTVRFLVEAGIPATGNRSMQGMSLYEAAQIRGIDPQALEDKINDYLSSK